MLPVISFLAAIAVPLVASAPSPTFASDLENLKELGMSKRSYRPDLYEYRDGGWRNKNGKRWDRNGALSKRHHQRLLTARQATCLDSTYDQDDINNMFSTGQDNTVVSLCPGAVIKLTGPVIFTNYGQELNTLGLPTGPARAKLQVTGPYQDVAIYDNCDRCVATKIRNIEIDGARPALGWMGNGAGLLEIGGNPSDQIVEGCYIHDPRGWTAMHVIEGYMDGCRRSNILGNQVGPAGTAPDTSRQFRKREQDPGRWADGISLACGDSVVTGNTITGATDGGIVLFGATGSSITGNTIIAKDNTLLGGINMVDHGPFQGDYTGVNVQGNNIRTENAMIKIGIAVGLMTWGTYNDTSFRTHGGNIAGNSFSSAGGAGYFGYGIANAGHDYATIQNNNFGGALFSGTQSNPCIQGLTPTPQAAVWDRYTTTGASLQADYFNSADIAFLICMMPCQYDSSCTRKPTGPALAAPVQSSSTSSSSTTSSRTTSTSTTSSTSTRTSSSPTSTSTSTATSRSTSATSSSSRTTSTSTSTTSRSTSTSSTPTRGGLFGPKPKTSTTTTTKTTSTTSSAKTTTTKVGGLFAPVTRLPLTGGDVLGAQTSTSTSTTTTSSSVSLNTSLSMIVTTTVTTTAQDGKATTQTITTTVSRPKTSTTSSKPAANTGKGLLFRPVEQRDIKPIPLAEEDSDWPDFIYDKRDVLADPAYWQE